MKKETRQAGWLFAEIESWQREGIISAEQAQLIKARYAPKKRAGLLRLLFSVIGTLLIGAGVVLIGAHNLWYKLPLALRAVIAFLPATASHALLIYVWRSKMQSAAWREGAAILNMAGVFSSIAIVGQVFHLPGDFTGYLLCCGVLSLPSMLALEAAAPLAIYYGCVLSGGGFIEGLFGVFIMLLLYGAGAAYAVYGFRQGGGKAAYLAWITIISGYAAAVIAAIKAECEPTVILLCCVALSLALSNRAGWPDMPFKVSGAAVFLVMISLFTFEFIWDYSMNCELLPMLLTGAFSAAVFWMGARELWKRRCPMLTAAALTLLALRLPWSLFELDSYPYILIFPLLCDAIMLAAGVYYIWSGGKRAELLPVNMGMASVCILILLRFFDSELPLWARGVVFLLIGLGFLAVNRRFLSRKKEIGEGAK